MSPISIPGKVTLQKQYSTVVSDPDATTYLQAVEAADGQTLEIGVAQAVNDFVVGCKADGIWNAINASCIMAGARTLAGALVPLKGTAPTNNNFVAGDYDRETGLKGDGSTKYLDSNRNNNTDPQNSKHLFCRVTETPSGTMAVMGAGSNTSGSSNITFVSSLASYRVNSSTTGGSATLHSLGSFGASRSSSLDFTYISNNGTVANASQSSSGPYNGSIHVFRRNASSTLDADARLSFYSIGESLDLALLDARVTTLMSDIGAAIP